ncbi:MAG: TetR/AcrR family transcriptional regulator [Chloroflexi bacterium]|nr:TetR/AcrR family transcriptional regulator [Chloroflexota bacterium]
MTSENDLREQILATAKSMFIQQGYHGLAMRQISEALGVSKAALYYHFKDKEELFLAILTSYLDDIESLLDRILAEQASNRDRIGMFVAEVLRQPAEQRAVIRLASQEMAQLSAAARKDFDKLYRQKFIGKLAQIFQQGVDAGEFRPLQTEVATWALMGIMYPYFYPAHTGDKPLPAETIQTIVDIYLNGVTQA